MGSGLELRAEEAKAIRVVHSADKTCRILLADFLPSQAIESFTFRNSTLILHIRPFTGPEVEGCSSPSICVCIGNGVRTAAHFPGATADGGATSSLVLLLRKLFHLLEIDPPVL